MFYHQSYNNMILIVSITFLPFCVCQVPPATPPPVNPETTTSELDDSWKLDSGEDLYPLVDNDTDRLEPAESDTHWKQYAQEIIPQLYYDEMHMEDEKFDEFWMDVENLLEKEEVYGTKNHSHLANSYRRAVNHQLSNFVFPFYGQPTKNLTIATGGFIYMGQTMHSWLAATQYIAPLMGNFDTSVSPDSNILFVETKNMTVVEWRQVVLREQQNDGNFTFQVQLHESGDIIFLYKHIPFPVMNISDQYHPRKVGLSDAYLMQTPVLTFKKRVIYEYHRIEVDLQKIKNRTVIVIHARPSCISITNCNDCHEKPVPNFNCTWCNQPGGGHFCSDAFGLHRRRQDWIQSNCDKQTGEVYCNDQTAPDTPTPTTTAKSTTTVIEYDSTTQPAHIDTIDRRTEDIDHPAAEGRAEPLPNQASTGSIIGILFVVASAVVLVGWVVYAYLNPHTASGQMLIRYRPSRWRVPGNHGDVRYTASVHM